MVANANKDERKTKKDEQETFNTEKSNVGCEKGKQPPKKKFHKSRLEVALN